MKREIEIRLDWDKALANVEYGTELSLPIDYGFTDQDLFVLCCLHEAGMHREKIVDLLEDCNFHTECGLIYEGKYDECRKVIKEGWSYNDAY